MTSLQVALLIDTDDQWGRTIVRKMIQLAYQRQWRLLIAPRDAQHRLRVPRGWQGDAVIASIRDRSLAGHLQRLNLPVVDVSFMFPKEEWFFRVCTDDQARARLAVDYFMTRGYRNFATYAPQMGRYHDRRSQLFADEVRSRGGTCHNFSDRPSGNRRSGWNVEHPQLERWLKGLPHPTAIFAADPYPARQIAEACLLGQILVPQQIAILSGDDDDLLCQTASPTLSAIQLDCIQLAKLAVEAVDRLQRSPQALRQTITLEPLSVLTRQSTDRLATDDPLLQEFFQLASEHWIQPLPVSKVAARLSVSTRSLQCKVHESTGLSPSFWLKQIRLDNIRQQVLTSNTPLKDLAFRFGFSSSSEFTRQYQAQFGRPPSQDLGTATS